MFDEKVIKVIENALRTVENQLIPNCDKAEKIAKALWDSCLVSNSSKSLDEQDLNVYMWTAIENDGYTHSEIGVANNMLEAFVKATEYSPSYHKYIEIKRVEEEDYTKEQRDLLEWYKKIKQ